MDAVKFLEEWKRMFKNGKPVPAFDIDTNYESEEVVKIVEDWSAAHPKKTRQDIFLEQYPEAVLTEDGVISICPVTVSAAYRNEAGSCNSPIRPQCDVCCREFWTKVVG